MSYQVLARKWRPKSFREMVGQEHVLQALINALDHDRLHHAYLFTGTRGVGKTTIARILAKCLNCEAGVSSEPCGTCASCVEIAEGRSVDLLEVDAASRTKVEDTRELLDNVQYAPTHSRFKVYLIDEVHMLSTHSFNALLKTLEEPPPHVKFLLATTDPQKLPATVLSRCLQFNLKNMPPEQIVGHLSSVLEQEMVTYEEPALWLLGRAASGSMRDALSLTDQAIAFGSGKIIEDDVRAMLGSVDLTFVYQLLEAVAAGEPAEVLQVVSKMGEHAPDFEGSLDELLSLLHRVATAQVVPDAIDNSWGDAQRVAAIASSISAEDAQLFYQVALNGKRDIGLAPDAKRGFEMILLRMLAFRPVAVLDDSLDPAQLTEVAAAAPAAAEGGDPAKKPHSEPSPVVREVRSQETPDKATPRESTGEAMPRGGGSRTRVASAAVSHVAVETARANVETIPFATFSAQHWVQVLEALGLGGIVYNIAANCELRSVGDGNVAFVLDEASAALYNDNHRDKLQTALSSYFDTAVTLTITPGVTKGETPAAYAQRLKQERQAQAEQAIESDAQLQSLIARFDGELDRASIAPIVSDSSRGKA